MATTKTRIAEISIHLTTARATTVKWKEPLVAHMLSFVTLSIIFDVAIAVPQDVVGNAEGVGEP